MSINHKNPNRQHLLVCMSFDGDCQFEYPNDNSVDGCWDYNDDMGSRWYFYPFRFVVIGNSNIVKSAPEKAKWLEGKRLSTVVRMFKAMSEKLSEDCKCGIDEYMYLLWKEYNSGN